MDFQKFFLKHQTQLEENYPGLKLAKFLEWGEENFFTSLEYPYLEKKLLSGYPLQYLANNCYFYNSHYFVDERVLIPRSETEILVDLALNFLKSHHANECRVVDVGTGSGAIILSLLGEMKNKEKIQAFATDISSEALEVAKFNYQRGEIVHHQVTFLQGDRLQCFSADEKFHLILSNPPYIKKNEDFMTTHKQVRLCEPHLALFLEDEIYVQWYEDFFTQMVNRLFIGGMAIVEGHESHLEHLREIAKKLSFSHVEIKKDYTDRNRFLIVKK